MATEHLPDVARVEDDLFATSLEPTSSDLVHARFELTSLGRVEEQPSTYVRPARAGGVVVLRTRLAQLALQATRLSSRAAHFTYLRDLPALDVRRASGPTSWRSRRGALLWLPLQFATAPEGGLVTFVDGTELARLRADGDTELQDPGRWRATFTLLQS